MTKNLDLIHDINKEVGDPDALQYGSSERFEPSYLSTGIRTLDTALAGGLRKSSFVLLTGAFSSGKTLLAQYFIKEAQKAGLVAAYLDAERAFNQTWMAQSGVDCDKLLVSQTCRGEKAFNIVHALIRHGVGLIIIDSLAALITTSRAEEDMEKQSVGDKAQMINKAIEKMLDALEEARSDTIVVAINQYRKPIGGGPGAPRDIPPGGEGQTFYNHLWLKVRRAGWEVVKSKKKSDKYPQKVGFTMAVEIFKSKQCVPFQNVRIPFDFRTQLDEVAALVYEALDFGVIEAHGSYYDLDGQRFQGRSKLLDYVREHPETLDKLSEALQHKDDPDE
jgi:recombination protein RecA